MINAFAMRKNSNPKLWEPLLADLDKWIQLGSVNNIEIFYLMRALHTVGLLEDELTKSLIDYLVKRGYDSDDLISMSSKRGGYRRAVHLIWLVSESNPTIKNKHFMMHIYVFAQNCYKDMNGLQQMRLYNALKKLKHFKNEKLLNQLRKGSFGKQIGASSSSQQDGTVEEEEMEGAEWLPEDEGYFTGEDSELEGFHQGHRDGNDFDVDEEEFKKHEEKFRNSRQ